MRLWHWIRGWWRSARARDEILDAAAEDQADEQRAAIDRVLRLAGNTPNRWDDERRRNRSWR